MGRERGRKDLRGTCVKQDAKQGDANTKAITVTCKFNV